MKAREVNLIEFFREPMQMIVSNSRSYRWTKEYCEKLWDDIIHTAKNGPGSSHFIGTIIYVEQGILPRTRIPRFILVDGQQRLATISLLLITLEERDGAPKDLRHKEIHNLLLYNGQEKAAFRHKLILADKDQDTFLRISRGEVIVPTGSSALEQNYLFFKNIIDKSSIDSSLIYTGIGKLTFMPISTDRIYENPRFIYESINSTGLDTEQTSLIRNWLGLLSSS